MAKTTFIIPTTDIVITAHNKREADIAWLLCHEIEQTAEAAIEGYGYATEACGEFGGGYIVDHLQGYAAAMYHLEMLEEPLSTIEIAGFMRAAYLEMQAEQEAGNETA